MLKKLCSRCGRGEGSYALDPRSPECPYLSCHDGKHCPMYAKMKPRKKLLSAWFKPGTGK